eukprot:scaffold25607_cov97-Isochrysis_galbana.AAC.2
MVNEPPRKEMHPPSRTAWLSLKIESARIATPVAAATSIPPPSSEAEHPEIEHVPAVPSRPKTSESRPRTPPPHSPPPCNSSAPPRPRRLNIARRRLAGRCSFVLGRWRARPRRCKGGRGRRLPGRRRRPTARSGRCGARRRR